jgi:hypothetical protein
LYEREFIGVLLRLTEIKLNYFKDTDTQQDAFRKDINISLDLRDVSCEERR